MTSEEAKMLLSVRRPGGADDAEPEMKEALALAAKDPQLGSWLAEEQAFDATITGRLSEYEVPAELRARILAGMSASLQSPRKINRRIFWWSASAAAAAAVAAGLIPSFSQKHPQSAQFRTEMLDFFNNRFADNFDMVEPDPAAVIKWLRTRPEAIAFQPPGSLPKGKTIGCKIIAWADTSVTLVCFLPPGSPMPIHIFAVQSTALADSDHPPGREFVSQAGWNTALWSSGNHTFMAISKLPEYEMTRLLQT